jgi:phosphoesterase RecJ-like protein
MELTRRLFQRHQNFALTTHEGADADGIGAEIALCAILRAMKKSVRIFNAAPTPDRFAFIDPETMVETYSRDDHDSFVAGSALIVLDSSDKGHLGILADAIGPLARELFAIDHHERPKTDLIEGWIDTAASSTCEMVVRLSESLGMPLGLVGSIAAYAGMVYDTNSFVYPKTTADTLMTAGRLVESGVVPNSVYQAMYESDSLGSLLLQKRVLSTLELHGEGRIAFQSMMKTDLDAAGAGYEDADSLVNVPLRCKSIEVSILVKETPEGRLRGSLRSKGRINVSDVAQHFGGGGHRTAAGFKCAKGLAETKAEVLQKVSAALEAASSGCR